MEGEGSFTKLWFCAVAVLFALICCTTAVDTILPGQTIRDGETIVLSKGNFELGFYSPENSTDRFVGIWSKKTSPRQLILVLNANEPLTNTSGELSLTNQGSFVIRYNNGHVVWSTRKLSDRKLIGRLFNDGMFIIIEESNDRCCNRLFVFERSDLWDRTS